MQVIPLPLKKNSKSFILVKLNIQAKCSELNSKEYYIYLPVCIIHYLQRYRRYAKYKNQIEQEAPGGETFLQQMGKCHIHLR